MNTEIIPRILIALSIVYGGLVAITAVTGFANVGMVASVGGIIIGVCWAVYAVLVPKQSDDA